MEKRKTVKDYELALIMRDLLERYANTLEEEGQEAMEPFGMWEILDMLRTRFDMLGISLREIHMEEPLEGKTPEQIRKLLR